MFHWQPTNGQTAWIGAQWFKGRTKEGSFVSREGAEVGKWRRKGLEKEANRYKNRKKEKKKLIQGINRLIAGVCKGLEKGPTALGSTLWKMKVAAALSNVWGWRITIPPWRIGKELNGKSGAWFVQAAPSHVAFRPRKKKVIYTD